MPKLTVAADLSWRIAALEAQRGRASAVTVDHLLVGLLSLDKVLGPSTDLSDHEQEAIQPEHEALNRVLGDLGLDQAALRRAIRSRILATSVTGASSLRRDPACVAAFGRAERRASAQGEATYGVLQILSAILDQPPLPLLAALGDVDRLRSRIEVELAPRPAPSVAPTQSPPLPEGPLPVQSAEASAPPVRPLPPVLRQYGRDLTAEAVAGRLPPVIGRHDEMLKVVRVLHRRIKNGPVLIGEAGVGKTAVVEGLAQRIAEGTVLPGRRIVALNMATVVAGTTYRGQFEERLEEILAAVRTHPEVILFLDELHTIVGAGDADGRLDAAVILKPALARGEIACIGATTVEEYRRHIEPDPALERRFQPILVAEPSRSDAMSMLEGLRPMLERHHGVEIQDRALTAAVELTVRLVADRRLPDKAVDALDEACARANVPGLHARPRQPGGIFEERPPVTHETVAAVVAAWTGRAGPSLSTVTGRRLPDLEARLAERVVGQSEAIRRVAERLRLARAGLTDPERPAAVLLLTGPSGVGKTELALAVADLLAEDEADPTALIRLAMSELAGPHQIPLLLGTSAGGGRERAGQLIGPLRRNPRALVLLDDIEQAHPDVVDSLLPLLGAGRLSDPTGRVVDARQAVFVLTARTSAGAAGQRPLGFAGAATEQHRAGGADTAGLRALLGPALLARVDEIVELRPLGEADLLEIARRRVAGLRQRLLEHQTIDVTVTDDAVTLLVRRALTGTSGAREVDRVITRLLAEPLSRELHAGRLARGARLLADATGDTITLVHTNTDPAPSQL